MRPQVRANEVFSGIFAAQSQGERLAALRQISDIFDIDENLEKNTILKKNINDLYRVYLPRNKVDSERTRDLSTDEFALNRCLEGADFEQIIHVFGGLSDLPRNSIKLLFSSDEPDLLLFVSRALNLAYSTVRNLLAFRSAHARNVAYHTPDEDFIRDWNERISVPKAARILRFISFRLHAKHRSANLI